MDDEYGVFLQMFKEEAVEYVRSLTSCLLDLEEKPEDTHGIREGLRNAHSLKGCAQMIDLDHISGIAHAIEDVLRSCESGQFSLSKVVTSQLLKATDIISGFIERLPEKDESVAYQNVAADIRGLLDAGTPAPATSPVVPEKKKSLPKPKKVAPPPPEQAEKTPPVEAPGPASKQGEDTIRVSTSKLDALHALSATLSRAELQFEDKLHRCQHLLTFFQHGPVVSSGDKTSSDGHQAWFKEVRGLVQSLVTDLGVNVIELRNLAEEIQYQSLAVRMLPFGTVTGEYRRMVRDIADELKKEVRLVVKGEEQEVDRRLIEEIRAPIMHMVRNSIDHGIETPSDRLARGKDPVGTITIKAERERGRVVIICEDDGKGLDPQLIRETASARGLGSMEELSQVGDAEILYFIMRPGFTTAKQVTALSGRGVGMDVVKSNVERLRGRAEIESQTGKFTRFKLILPLSLSLVNVLMVECEGHIFGIPSTNIQDTDFVDPDDQIFTEGGVETIEFSGRMVPLCSLAEVVGLSRGVDRLRVERLRVAVISHHEQQMAFVVDDLLEQEKIVLESRGRILSHFPMVSGASILGNGDPCLILDVTELFRRASQMLPSRSKLLAQIQSERKARRKRVLVVEDSLTTRMMEKSILESFGYEVDAASSGEDALTKLTPEPHDLVVTDIQMPGMDGFELVAHLKGHGSYQSVPVVVVSSFYNEESLKKGADLGVDAFISKGTFQQSQLVETVQRLLAGGSPL